MAPLVLEWNMRGFRANFADIQAVLSQRKPAVACLQETKLSPGSYCSLNGYSVFRKDIPTFTVVHGGTMLAVHHSVLSKMFVYTNVYFRK